MNKKRLQRNSVVNPWLVAESEKLDKAAVIRSYQITAGSVCMEVIINVP